MSKSQEEDETQIEQEFEDYEDEFEEPEDQEIFLESMIEEPEQKTIPPAEAEPVANQSKKREKREPVNLVREPGKTLLPFARVQKIIKADKEIPIVAKEATFLIALATEEFIKRFCEAGQLVAHREKRSTIQHRDLAAVSRRADEFVFLEEIMPLTSVNSDPSTKRAKPVKARDGKATLLDQFVVSKKAEEEGEEGDDIIMNEDGTIPGREYGVWESTRVWLSHELHKYLLRTYHSQAITSPEDMKVISTFHPSSSVISSVKCRLASRDLEHLVVATLNRLDVYSLRPHGLQRECTLNVWGKICSVKALPLSEYETRSNIVVMLTHPEPELILLAYTESSDGVRQLIVKKQISLSERLPRTSEFFTDFLIHPSGKLGVVSCYAGKLKIVSFRGGIYQQDFDVSLPEINIFSLAFLPILSSDEYSLAILHFDSQERLQLCARDIDVEGFELSKHFSTHLLPTVINDKVAPHPVDSPLQMIPVPPPDDIENPETPFLGGILVVGGKQLVLYELASAESQEKQRGKLKRLDAKKKSNDAAETAKARAKEQERGNRKRKSKASVEWPWSEVSAWCPIDPVSARYLISDSFGRLSMISLENINELGIILIPLGEISSPTTVTYLTNQTAYVGSHLGDSQLIHISETPVNSQDLPSLAIPPGINVTSPTSINATSSRKGKEKVMSDENDMDVDDDESGKYAKGRVIGFHGSFIKVLESYKNIAPIMDAIVVDTDDSGQSQIVTCSGGANTGSINIVRNGADFKELGSVSGLTGITRIWSIRTIRDDIYDTHILTSTVNETNVFAINDTGGNVTWKLVATANTSFPGIVSNQPTLAFSHFCKRENGIYAESSLVVQVVPTGAFLLEWDPSVDAFVERSSWEAKNVTQVNNGPSEIVAASANTSQVALALNGGKLVILCIDNGVTRFRELIKHSTQSEISAVSFLPLDPKKKFSSQLAVAYWTSNVVELFTLREGALNSDASTRSPPLPAVVRSLLLHNFGSDTSSKGADYHPYLLAGLGDGSVASLHWKGGSLQDLKILSLGHAPVTLTPCEVDGRISVFAAGNKSTIFFCEKNRLANSAIFLKEIFAACRLNTRSFANALALAAPTGISIGSIRDLDKMHMRSVFFGLDNPRRVVHEPMLKVFGVSCTRIDPERIGNYGILRSSFHLLDDNSLNRLGQYHCEPEEEITSITPFKTKVQDENKPFFCLGTMLYKEDEKEPASGRLLIFSAFTPKTPTRTSGLELSLIASATVEGCVYALKIVGDRIVAAVNSSVLLYRLETSTEDVSLPFFSLKKLAEWNHNYMVTSLGSFEDSIVAGDQISSVSLLKVVDDKLVSVARDYGPLYPISVEALNSTAIIVSNDTLNVSLFSLSKGLRGEVLETIGSFHLADMATKFVRGALSSIDRTKKSCFIPEAMFFTSSGKIGVISDIQDHDLSLDLSRFQENLVGVISGVGNQSHATFRSPKNTRGTSDAEVLASGFLDGDFLEQFLGLLNSPERLNKVLEGNVEQERLKLSTEEITKILEELQSLH